VKEVQSQYTPLKWSFFTKIPHVPSSFIKMQEQSFGLEFR